MHLSLLLHHDSVCPAVLGLTVDIVRQPSNRVTLRYCISGALDDVRLPQPASPERRDKLWEHSCFEIFIRPPGADFYYEYNFAPSAAWAAYRFVSYRKGMALAADIATPEILSSRREGVYELEAAVQLGQFTDLADEPVWRIGLSAVIEETNGRKSYWALAHPDGKADFHHDACFALELKKGDA